jgi:hypothetical protein
MRAYILKGEVEDRIVILNEEKFEEKPGCETYDRYGNKVGCANNGCLVYGSEFWTDDSEEDHYTLIVYEYFDGNNWKTLVVKNDYNDEVDLELHDDSDEIVDAYLIIKNDLKWKLSNQDPRRAEVEVGEYRFIDSNYSGFFAVQVEII